MNLRNLLTDERFLIVWGVLVVVSLAIALTDIARKNQHIVPLMKWVWSFTVLYSGPFGLLIYWFTGRKEIRRDSVWRKGFRSVAHCYSGCGAGEIIGVVTVAGIFGLGNWPTAIVTFLLAYVMGFALTVGPLMQEGVSFKRAVQDALWAETPSITMMEISAIGVDLWLARSAGFFDAIFWSSLVASLSVGLVVAYPVNVLLIHFGIKHGMADPRDTSSRSLG